MCGECTSIIPYWHASHLVHYRPKNDQIHDKSFLIHIWMISKILDQTITVSSSCSFLLYIGEEWIPQLTENVNTLIQAFEHIISKLKTITNCKSPWSPAFIKAIIKRLACFKNM